MLLFGKLLKVERKGLGTGSLELGTQVILWSPLCGGRGTALLMPHLQFANVFFPFCEVSLHLDTLAQVFFVLC